MARNRTALGLQRHQRTAQRRLRFEPLASRVVLSAGSLAGLPLDLMPIVSTASLVHQGGGYGANGAPERGHVGIERSSAMARPAGWFDVGGITDNGFAPLPRGHSHGPNGWQPGLVAHEPSPAALGFNAFVTIVPNVVVLMVVDLPPTAQEASTITTHDVSNRLPMSEPGRAPTVAQLTATSLGAPDRGAPSPSNVGGQVFSAISITAGLSGWLAGAVQSAQDGPDGLESSASVPWLSSAPIDPSSGNESAQTPGAPLLPDYGTPEDRDREGGLIELETSPAAGSELSQDDETIDRSKKNGLPGLDEWVDLDWLWSRWEELVDGAAEAQQAAKSQAATRDRETAREVAQVEAEAHEAAAIALDAEGGLIELVAPSASFDAPEHAHAIRDGERFGDGPVAIEAEVALFQVFELGAPPVGVDATDSNAERQSALPPADEKASADETSETSNHHAAGLTSAGLLLALPVSIRRRRQASKEAGN